MPDVAASVDPEPEAIEALPKLSLRRTEFGVDLGSANTVSGLRMLWRGLLKSRANAQLAALQPIIMVREGSGGLGLQLAAGRRARSAMPRRRQKSAPCWCESQRACETTVFDGQRLVLQGDEPPRRSRRHASVLPPRSRRRARSRPGSRKPPRCSIYAVAVNKTRDHNLLRPYFCLHRMTAYGAGLFAPTCWPVRTIFVALSRRSLLSRLDSRTIFAR